MRPGGALVALGAAALVCSACSDGLRHPPYSPQPQSALVEVDAPPPPGRVETIAPSPERSAVWIDGEWQIRRGRWSWLAGRWVEPPAGATFSPWVFVRGADARLWYAKGAWRDAHGQSVPAPSPLESAMVEAAEVLNARGMTETTGRTRVDRGDAPRAPENEVR